MSNGRRKSNRTSAPSAASTSPRRCLAAEPRVRCPWAAMAVECRLAACETRTMIPVYRLPAWTGVVTGLRIGFDNAGAGKIVIKSFHTACDTRHSINNPNFIRGVHDYFTWSRDLAFLGEQSARVRHAMRFTMREFQTRQRNCIYTTWPGHEGRSGVQRTADGKKQIVRWRRHRRQLLGSSSIWRRRCLGHDLLLRCRPRPGGSGRSRLPRTRNGASRAGADAFDPGDLRQHARAVKAYGSKRFWNEETGRFGTVDLDGVLHDYGWTFLNNEAVYYDFVTPDQARRIRDLDQRPAHRRQATPRPEPTFTIGGSGRARRLGVTWIITSGAGQTRRASPGVTRCRTAARCLASPFTT